MWPYFSDDFLNSSFEENRKHRSPSHRLSILQKLRSSRVSLSKLKKSIKKDKDDEIEHNFNSNNSYYGNKKNNIGKINSVFTQENFSEKPDMRVCNNSKHTNFEHLNIGFFSVLYNAIVKQILLVVLLILCLYFSCCDILNSI